MHDFETKIKALDIRLFDPIPSQSTDMDRTSLLACQAAVREMVGEYAYLEIGSYLGGSIQPHLADPRCRRIYSIDKRPPVQPDERGFDWGYKNNSTRRMLDLLAESVGDVAKITTIDGSTAELSTNVVAEPADLCFIDGEHTDNAALRDFRFCREVAAADGVIIFHDAHIIYNAISAAITSLKSDGVDFRAYILPHTVFVIEIGILRIHEHAEVRRILTENGHAYLFALTENDRFRRFATGFPFGAVRRLYTKIRGASYSE